MTRAPWLSVCSTVLALAGEEVQLVAHQERPWASATFSGTRHKLTLRLSEGVTLARAEQLQRVLPDHEFSIPGQIVADAAVTAVVRDFEAATATVTCELLLIEET